MAKRLPAEYPTKVVGTKRIGPSSDASRISLQKVSCNSTIKHSRICAAYKVSKGEDYRYPFAADLLENS